MQKPLFAASVVVLLATQFACGGGGTDPAAPSAPVTQPPAVTATPRPTPAPTPDPRAGLAAGPVTRFAIKVRTIDNGTRDAVPDDQGRFVVFVGERVDFDATQKNGSGDICQWVNDPRWFIDGHDVPFETSQGIVYRRGSSQPFLLKLTMQEKGTFAVAAHIDGIDSNVLEMRVR